MNELSLVLVVVVAAAAAAAAAVVVVLFKMKLPCSILIIHLNFESFVNIYGFSAECMLACKQTRLMSLDAARHDYIYKLMQNVIRSFEVRAISNSGIPRHPAKPGFII